MRPSGPQCDAFDPMPKIVSYWMDILGRLSLPLLLMLGANVCTGIALARAMKYRKRASVSSLASQSPHQPASLNRRRNTSPTTPISMKDTTNITRKQRRNTESSCLRVNVSSRNNNETTREQQRQTSLGNMPVRLNSLVSIQHNSARGRIASTPDITTHVAKSLTHINANSRVHFTSHNSADPLRAADASHTADSATVSISTNTALNLSASIPSAAQSSYSSNAFITASARDTRGVNRMLVLVCVSFVVLYSPAFVFELVESVADIWLQSYSDTRSHLLVLLAWQTSVTLLYTHHATNFVLYMLSAREFRREFVAIFGNLVRFKHK